MNGYSCNFCGKQFTEVKKSSEIPSIEIKGSRNGNYLKYDCCINCITELLEYFGKREDAMQFKVGEKGGADERI